MVWYVVVAGVVGVYFVGVIEMVGNGDTNSSVDVVLFVVCEGVIVGIGKSTFSVGVVLCVVVRSTCSVDVVLCVVVGSTCSVDVLVGVVMSSTCSANVLIVFSWSVIVFLRLHISFFQCLHVHFNRR